MSINFVEIMLLGKVTNIGIFNCFIIRVSNFMKIRPPSHFLGLARILQLQCIKPGGEGYSPKFWVGVCRTVAKTLTLFQTKMYDFAFPFLDLNPKTCTPFDFRPSFIITTRTLCIHTVLY